MTIIFDLDHTLFFADRFREALARALRPYGISASEFARTYALLRREKKGTIAYSPERHLSVLAKTHVFNRREAQRACEIVMQNALRFLDPQTVPTLRTLRQRGHRLVLMTRGETGFQNKKISALGLRRYFHTIIVSSRRKHLSFPRLALGNDTLVFVNDNAQELHEICRTIPRAIIIERLRRNAPRTSKLWPAFSTLPAIGRAIDRLHIV